MSGVGTSWYAQNRSRNYPLAGSVTALDNNGKRLPESLIADIKLRFDGNATDRAYVSYAESSDSLVVIVSVGNDPIAVASIRQAEARDWLPVPFTSLVAGVTGYVVFGPTDETGCWEFLGPDQSGLSLRSASPQPGNDTPNRFSRFGFTPMTGQSLYISGQGDVSVRRESRVLEGQARDAIVVSLRPELPRDVIASYAGQCGQRPESGTCNSPLPIERINGVRSDCCERLFIEFTGCVEMTPLQDECGVVIICDITTEEACPSKDLTLPTADGDLPGEDPRDECESDDEPDPISDQDTVLGLPGTGQSFLEDDV